MFASCIELKGEAGRSMKLVKMGAKIEIIQISHKKKTSIELIICKNFIQKQLFYKIIK